MATASDFLEEAAGKVRTRLDKLNGDITKIETDLREKLAPLHRERDELEEALSRITGRGARRRSTTATGGGSRTARGKNQEAILTTLGTGQMAPTEIADATGIARNVTYNTLARLAEHGAVTKVDVGGGRVEYMRA